MVATQNVADAWIYATLDAALTVPVSNHPAPLGSVAPYVTFTALSGLDNLTGGGFRFVTRYRYVVRAIAQGNAYPYALADAIDAALDYETGTAVGGSVVSSVRMAPFQLAEDIDGVPYRHLGGEYQLIIHTP